MSKYRSDYPKVPTSDNDNPYYMCAFCERSDPQINGDIDGHTESCAWRVWVENGESDEEPKRN